MFIFLHLDWNHLFDVSIIKIRPSYMSFCWSFLFPERPIPDEINPLSRTQVPLLWLVNGVLNSYHCKVPKRKDSGLAVLRERSLSRTSYRTVLCSDVTDVVRSRRYFPMSVMRYKIGSLTKDDGDFNENGKKAKV